MLKIKYGKISVQWSIQRCQISCLCRKLMVRFLLMFLQSFYNTTVLLDVHHCSGWYQKLVLERVNRFSWYTLYWVCAFSCHMYSNITDYKHLINNKGCHNNQLYFMVLALMVISISSIDHVQTKSFTALQQNCQCFCNILSTRNVKNANFKRQNNLHPQCHN